MKTAALPLRTAAEGGIALQNLREYVEGDDLRLVHWRSLAKTGTLMVRHNVDTHQPRSVIVLDTRENVYTEESFEDAVEVTASIVMASMLNHFPFRLETTCGRTANSLMTKASVMDMLASLTLVERGAMQNAVGPLSRDPGGASLAVVSGRCTSVDLACLAPIRKRFDQYVNLRPMRLLPGVACPLGGRGPADLDMVCVRENSEGEYSGQGERTGRGADERAEERAVFTRKGIERIARYAFGLAARRPRRLLASATKSNALRHTMVL